MIFKQTFRRVSSAMLSAMMLAGTASAAFNENVGTSGAQFLKMGVNARAIAMGEAYSTVSEDASALYWNPAGLGSLHEKSLSMLHSSYLQNIFYDYGSYAHSLSKYGTAAISFQYLSSPRINHTDEVGTDLGTFRVAESAVTVGYGKAFEGKDLAVGLSGKVIQSKIVETATAFAADAGFVWTYSPKMRFGAAVQNLGDRLQFVNKSEELPFNLKFGSVYRFWKPALIALDVNFPRDNDPFIAVGSEYKYHIGQKLSVAGRVGYNGRTGTDLTGINSMSTGLGLEFGAFEFDFAWAPFGQLGNTYRYGLIARF